MNDEIPEYSRKGSPWRKAGIAFMIVVPCVLVIAVTFPVTSPVIRSTDRGSQDRREVINLVRAVTAYNMEYSMLPIPQDMFGRDSFQTETDEEMMKVLLGLDDSPDGLNPRTKKFYDGKEANKGLAGLWVVGEAVGPRLVDAWGRPYLVVIDADYDGFVIGPDGARIGQSVICYSLGEDGVFDAKDPRSW